MPEQQQRICRHMHLAMRGRPRTVHWLSAARVCSSLVSGCIRKDMLGKAMQLLDEAHAQGTLAPPDTYAPAAGALLPGPARGTGHRGLPQHAGRWGRARPGGEQASLWLLGLRSARAPTATLLAMHVSSALGGRVKSHLAATPGAWEESTTCVCKHTVRCWQSARWAEQAVHTCRC